MMSDAFTTKSEWIGRMILDLMDPIKYNNNMIKDSFLSNMFRIVSTVKLEKESRGRP
jgi:hypothetical protein